MSWYPKEGNASRKRARSQTVRGIAEAKATILQLASRRPVAKSLIAIDMGDGRPMAWTEGWLWYDPTGILLQNVRYLEYSVPLHDQIVNRDFGGRASRDKPLSALRFGPVTH